MVKKTEGSITVEAVFIFPIILFIILALMYFSFYLHDQVVVHSVIDETNERLNQAVRQPTEFRTGIIYYDKMTDRSLLCRYNGDYSVEINDAKNFAKEKLKKHLMLGEVKSVDTTKSFNSISTEAVIESRINVVPTLVYLSKYQKSSITAKCEVNNPAEFTRAASVTLDVVSQTKAFDKLVKVVNKIDHVIN